MSIEIDQAQLDDYGLTREELDEFQQTQGLEAEYSKKSDFSKAMLAMECMKLTFIARAKEMRKGYYNFKYLPDGNELKIWIPDSRKEYVSAVKGLYIILSPELLGQPELLTKIQAIRKKESSVWKHFAYEEMNIDNDGIIRKTGVVFMPEADTEVLIENKDSYSRVTGAWDLKIEHYWNSMVELYDEIFEQLSILIHTLNYFKGKIRLG